MKSLTLKTPAKINLTLNIFGRRPDGYHEIESLMIPITLYDTITVTMQATDIQVHCPEHPQLDGENNLAHLAASLFLSESKQSGGISITIDKKIPIAAGLGGGSSDAACVLNALQALYHNPLSTDKIFQIAAKLGADVPFFIRAVPCMARGIGNLLAPYKNLPSFWVVIAQAPFGLSTAKVYQSLKYPLTTALASDNGITPVLLEDFEQLSQCIHNDLQPVVEQLFPITKNIRESFIKAGAVNSGITGSGPTVFGLYQTEEFALVGLEKIARKPNWKYFVARGITSPKQEPRIVN
jgi:4-diphosphocytidyl-2-C-methyl-D-erythritol kinase